MFPLSSYLGFVGDRIICMSNMMDVVVNEGEESDEPLSVYSISFVVHVVEERANTRGGGGGGE